MNRIFRILEGLTLAFAPLVVLSQDIDTTRVTLDELILEAKRSNPEILASKQMWLATKSRIISSQSLPDPQAGVMLEEKIGVMEKEKMWSYSFGQTIPFPTKLLVKGKLSEKSSEIAEKNYEAKEREVVSKVKETYYMLFLAYKSIEILQGNIELMRHFSRVAEQKYAVGKSMQSENYKSQEPSKMGGMSHSSRVAEQKHSVGKSMQSDILKSHVELSKMENMLITLEQERETAQAMLNTLINRPLESKIGISFAIFHFQLNLNCEELESLALDISPELNASKLAIKSSELALKLARMEYIPDFMLKSTFGGMGNGIMLDLMFPLYFWKQRAMVKEMASDKAMYEFDYQAMKNMTLYQIKELWVKAQTAARLIKLYKTSILPQAEQAIKIAETGYLADKVDFLDLIDAQRTLLDFQLDYYKYLVDYEHQLAELEKVVGKDLK